MNKYKKILLVSSFLLIVFSLFGLQKVQAYDYNWCHESPVNPEKCQIVPGAYKPTNESRVVTLNSYVNPDVTKTFTCPLYNGKTAVYMINLEEGATKYGIMGEITCGYHCFTDPANWSVHPPISLFKIDGITTSADYMIKGLVMTGNVKQKQADEDFHIRINGKESPVIRDTSGDNKVFAGYKNLGTFSLNSGLNEIYMVSNAPSCSPECPNRPSESTCKPNSVHLHQLCLYADLPECERCTPLTCEDPVTCDAPVNAPLPVEDYYLENLYSCTDPAECTEPETRYRSCYEILSLQPDVELILYPETIPTSYGFNSSSHTGAGDYKVVQDGEITDDRVNDGLPLVEGIATEGEEFYMKASFKDTDKKLEALYVWFRKDSEKPLTPKLIDLDNIANDPDTKSNKAFGFMLYREANEWLPYIGGGDGNLDAWVKADYSDNIFGIKRNGEDLVYVILDQENIQTSSDSKEVTLEFSLTFKNPDNPSQLNDRVENGKYNIWLMANDVFGFTPYDNYDDLNLYPDKYRYNRIRTLIHNKWITPERIRYYNQWKDTGKDWNIDLRYPTVSLSVFVEEDPSVSLKFSWAITDNLGIYGVVGNLYSDYEGISAVQIKDTDPSSSYIGRTYTPTKLVDQKVGHLNNDVFFKMISGSTAGSVSIDPLDNKDGIIVLYLTVFDKAGNSSSSYIEFDLRDWMITYGGLLYSNKGVDFPVRNFIDEPSAWSSKDFLRLIEYNKADITSELLGEVADSGSAPLKSGVTDSYNIWTYDVSNSSYYEDLKSKFSSKRSVLDNIEEIDVTTLTGSLTGQGVPNGQIGLVDTEQGQDLTIGSGGFLCNGKMVAFVDGDLIINGEITNENGDRDSCIFVISGDVIINEGPDSSGSGEMQYDEINAYVLADGVMTITPDTANVNDGLYVSGGLHSLTGFSMQRYLESDDRFLYPVFAVNHHSKYGVFAETLFSTANLVQIIEVAVR